MRSRTAVICAGMMVLSVTASCLVPRGSAKDLRGGGAAVQAVLRLENRWTRALVSHDVPAMQAILAPGMVYTENGDTIDRPTLLKALIETKEKTAVARNEGMVGHAYGNTVVVTGWLITKGTGPGGAFSRRYRYTDVWMKRSGRWQIVAAHDFLAPQ